MFLGTALNTYDTLLERGHEVDVAVSALNPAYSNDYGGLRGPGILILRQAVAGVSRLCGLGTYIGNVNYMLSSSILVMFVTSLLGWESGSAF